MVGSAVQDRLERTGMHWTVPGAEALLRLRCVALNVVLGVTERDYGSLYNAQLIFDETGRLFLKRCTAALSSAPLPEQHPSTPASVGPAKDILIARPDA